MTQPVAHISRIRVAQVEGSTRDARVSRRSGPSHGPIDWTALLREGGVRFREGHGRSGLTYRLVKSGNWRVSVRTGGGGELEVGRARMQEHALALAVMWEHAVLSGRVDVG